MIILEFIVVKNNEEVCHKYMEYVSQTDSRITYGIELENIIELKKGDVCEIIYSINRAAHYAIKCKKNVFDLGPFKIKFINNSSYADFICYMKIV